MSKRMVAFLAVLALAALWTPRAGAQTPPPYAMKKPPNPGGNSYPGPELIPYPPDRDSMDHRIDLFMADWHEAMPRHILGTLVLRDILTRGDNMAPPQRGAAFQRFNSL